MKQGDRTALLEIASHNASLPIEKGGLGLPAGNTNIDRLDVMYPEKGYHGTPDDFSVVDPEKMGRSQSLMGDALYSSSASKRPHIYAGGEGQIMPIRSDAKNVLDLTEKMSVPEARRIADVFEANGAKVEWRPDGTFFVKIGDKSAFIDNYRPMDLNFKSISDAFGIKNTQAIIEAAGFSGIRGAESGKNRVTAMYDPQKLGQSTPLATPPDATAQTYSQPTRPHQRPGHPRRDRTRPRDEGFHRQRRRITDMIAH